MLRTESITALAAARADEDPLASMTAAPRFCTVSMNLPFSQPWSEMTSGTGRPAIRAFQASGYWVVEWLPQIATLERAATGTLAFLASWVRARFSSSLVIANNRSSGFSGTFMHTTSQLRMPGLPTERFRTALDQYFQNSWP